MRVYKKKKKKKKNLVDKKNKDMLTGSVMASPPPFNVRLVCSPLMLILLAYSR